MSSESTDTAPAVVYEVSASVTVDENDLYVHFMKTRHIPMLMATGKFSHASMTSSQDPMSHEAADMEWVHYKINYVAFSAAHLQSFLTEDVAALRADFAQNGPKNAKISRRVWQVEQEWSHKQ